MPDTYCVYYSVLTSTRTKNLTAHDLLFTGARHARSGTSIFQNQLELDSLDIALYMHHLVKRSAKEELTAIKE